MSHATSSIVLHFAQAYFSPHRSLLDFDVGPMDSSALSWPFEYSTPPLQQNAEFLISVRKVGGLFIFTCCERGPRCLHKHNK